jgi:hypothetical protein
VITGAYSQVEIVWRVNQVRPQLTRKKCMSTGLDRTLTYQSMGNILSAFPVPHQGHKTAGEDWYTFNPAFPPAQKRSSGTLFTRHSYRRRTRICSSSASICRWRDDSACVSSAIASWLCTSAASLAASASSNCLGERRQGSKMGSSHKRKAKTIESIEIGIQVLAQQ